MKNRSTKRFAVLLFLSLFTYLPALRATGELSAVVGYMNNDANPSTGAISFWGGTGGVAVDCLLRSVALDFESSKKVRSITLRDNDGSSRLVAADYTIWKSDDNITYTQVTGWSLNTSNIDDRLIHTFRLPSSVIARYVKIHNHAYSGSTDYTFILADLSNDAIAASTVIGLLNNEVPRGPAWSPHGVAPDRRR